MKEYLFAYPIVFALFWSINWILAWFDLVSDCLPLRLYIVAGFTLAWIPYVANTPGFWPITLLFMFGVPYALFWVLFELPKVDKVSEFTDKNELESEESKKD